MLMDNTTPTADNLTLDDLQVRACALGFNGTNYSRDLDWTVSTALYGVTLALCVYILLALCLYERMVRSQPVAVDVTRSYRRPEKRDNKHAVLMRVLLIGAYVLMILRLLLEITESAFMEDFVHRHCDFFRKTEVVLFTQASQAVFLVMWVRQHALYTMGGRNILRGRFSGAVSVLVPAVMLAVNACLTVFYLTTKTFRATPLGCTLCEEEVSSKLNALLLVITQLFFHFLLLILFVYPLVRLQRHARKEGRRTPSARLRLVRRATAWTLVAAALNFLIFAAIVANGSNMHKNYAQSLYNVDFSVTSLCIFLTFSDWRCRLLPGYRSGQHRTDDDSSTGNTTQQRPPRRSSTIRMTMVEVEVKSPLGCKTGEVSDV